MASAPFPSISLDLSLAFPGTPASRLPALRKNLQKRAAALHGSLSKARQAGGLAYAELPYQAAPLLRQLRPALRRAGSFDRVLLLGIGGSALGARALHMALGQSAKPLRVLDNVDPDSSARVLDGLNLRRAFVCVVSKSGGTAETLAALLYVLEESRRRKQPISPNRIAVVTSRMDSDLAVLARRSGWNVLPIPDAVGGRFSVFSAAAMLPCMAAGLPVGEILRGARRCADFLWRGPSASNPALAAALRLYDAAREGKSIQVVMPYADSLLDAAAWYAQLWAESLGKERDLRGRIVRAGQTPVLARGASDQHSQLQLWREGPRDKAALFWRLGRFGNPGRLSRHPSPMDSFSCLSGRSLVELLAAESEATALSLYESGCPVLRYDIPSVSASHLGNFLYLLQHQTVAAAVLWGVNAFDQPGVESGKRAACVFMGRRGYEGETAALTRRRPPAFRIPS